VSKSSRLVTLLRRSLTAARFGFVFLGTTKTRFPKTVTLFGEQRILTTPNDCGYLNDVINIWLDDEYGLRKCSRPPRTIVDIGANIGLFSLWARHCFPDAVIHAYEPNSRVIPYTRSNLSGTRVKVFQEGVGAQQGNATMLDDRDSRMASTTASADGDVTITSLANVIERIGGSVDLIKFDCEGAEWEILTDRPSLKKVAVIRMEYHLGGRASIADFTECIENVDFTVDELVPNQGFGIAWLSRGTLGQS
jgi:FkbM family methyltransferase